jgi:hypothetical protein
MKYYNIITSFLPWIALSILSSVHPPFAFPAAIVLSLLSSHKLLKGFIVDWASLLFFIAAFVGTQILNNQWFIQHISVLICTLFVGIAAVSLLINKPYTLQYARLEVEKKYWDSPHFLRINQILTAGLGIIFLGMTLVNLYRSHHPGIVNGWVVWGAGLALQFVFVDRFPNWYRKRFIPK